ncbi:MBL fold metallo-hydrolase [Colwellia demingiae]|uniref:MBL fold metallo-hydrolase n=1 Tax=Colwellia demingiae TaxID=89401 RepID=A0A5C6QGZ2_9GAMM|nr:alkyl sulfatase dimerization domain-containing protein [Colwellia demingiae]TWX68119.1 MBL fold metallo-hydrolase [Colwellia demingiae]
MRNISVITYRFCKVLSLIALLSACSDPVQYEVDADEQGHTAPTAATIKVNESLLTTLPFNDRKDFDDVKRGFIAGEDNLVIKGPNDTTIWDMSAYNFIKYQGEYGNAPSSVNPSLWRQVSLNNNHGLYKLQDGIYQLRNYDLANMTIIESDNGWIIVDPLTAKETAIKALSFAQQHLGKKPIKAIIFTHSHIDHFGGIDGVLSMLSKDEKNTLQIIAPKGFLEEAVSENLIAGIAMGRRSEFMYGKHLARSERGHVGSGLGKGPAFGTFGLIEPTTLIDYTTNELNIDGVPFVFQYTPGSEAPAEFTFYLPEHKAFCGAEIVSKTMHNLYTLRGAKVRNATQWSAFIDQARDKFSTAELYFGSHHWPVWGQENIQSFMIQQRDTYKYIHDQTVRLMNEGHTPNEIAEMLVLPQSLQTSFSNRGYYGTLKHNVKAVYQAYMGWFTANPAMLDPLPEEETAKRYIAAMGGAELVYKNASILFEKVNELNAEEVNAEYRWIAQLLNQVVFAQPEHSQAKALLAKTYDQLGYMAESAPWRDFYLSGAYELRHGVSDKGRSLSEIKNVLLQTPVHKFFENMAVNLNGIRAEGESLTIKVNFTDLQQQYLLILENSVIRHKIANETTQAGTTINITKPLFIDLIVGDAGLKDTLFGEDLNIEGSKLDLLTFLRLIDKPQGTFNIVTP